MNDPDIIKLYLERSEEALSQTRIKYGAYLVSIARRLLKDRRDAEEVVSDSYLAAWRSIPPKQPEDLGAYMGALCRNAALDRIKSDKRIKRGSGEYEAVLDELSDIRSPGPGPEQAAEAKELREVLNGFLGALPAEKRRMFVQRYWYMLPEREIAKEAGISTAAVKMQLLRMRAALKEAMRKEGVYIE